jgi:hypothetical protein
MSNQQKADIMDLQGVNLDLFVKPLDDSPVEIVNIDKDIDQKTQSQRIRGVLYLLWKQEAIEKDFNIFYREKTERYIEFLKSKLEENPE